MFEFFFRKLETLRKTIQTQTIIQIYQNIEHYWIKIYRCTSILAFFHEKSSNYSPFSKKKIENGDPRGDIRVLLYLWIIFLHRFWPFFMKNLQIIHHFRKKKLKMVTPGELSVYPSVFFLGFFVDSLENSWDSSKLPFFSLSKLL